MIDALRLWLNRPLGERDRARGFALAAAVIAAAAGLLALLDRPAPPPPPATRPPAPAPRPAATVTPAASRALVERPSEEGNPSAAATVSPADVRAVKRTARRFLDGYLPYSYGRRRAGTIAGASPSLLRRLRAQRPRVPATERRRRARLVLLHANGAGPRAAAVVALIADGARRYTLPLELERTRTGWRVTRAGS